MPQSQRTSREARALPIKTSGRSPFSVKEEPLAPLMSDPALFAQHAVCVNPTSVYNAAEMYSRGIQGLPDAQPSANVTVTRGQWQLYEDRNGKPGWISNGPNGSTAEFAVRFGAVPRLTIAWTLGYEGFARVAVGFTSERNRGRVKVIQGMRTDGLRATQAAVMSMDVGHMHHGSRLDLDYGVAGWSIKPFTTERFRVELLCAGDPANMKEACGKFKLLELIAC